MSEPANELDSVLCFPLLDPFTAPKDGTVILGAFGWPWLIPASWNEHNETWTVCTLQMSPMEPDGKNDSWFETDWEKPAALIGWVPIPPLLPGTLIGGFLFPENSKAQSSAGLTDATCSESTYG